MPDIFLRFRASCPDCEYSDVYMDVKEMDLKTLLTEVDDSTLFDLGYVRVNTEKKIAPQVANFLRKYGWSHLEVAKSREDKKVLTQEYYLMYQGEVLTSLKFKKIDLEDLSLYELEAIAKGAKVVQVVSSKSVLPAVAYKKLQLKIKQLKEASLKRKEANEKKKAKKRALEIKNAKKLLEEAGEM